MFDSINETSLRLVGNYFCLDGLIVRVTGCFLEKKRENIKLINRNRIDVHEVSLKFDEISMSDWFSLTAEDNSLPIGPNNISISMMKAGSSRSFFRNLAEVFGKLETIPLGFLGPKVGSSSIKKLLFVSVYPERQYSWGIDIDRIYVENVLSKGRNDIFKPSLFYQSVRNDYSSVPEILNYMDTCMNLEEELSAFPISRDFALQSDVFGRKTVYYQKTPIGYNVGESLFKLTGRYDYLRERLTEETKGELKIV